MKTKVFNSLTRVMDQQLSEIQSRFRKSRGCADQIFTIRRIMEMTRRKRTPVHMCFIDLKAAYDSVNRDTLWTVLERYGVPRKLRSLIKALYHKTDAAVRVNGELTEWFEVKTGLRQGCLLSPALFNVYIDFVVREA